MKKAIILAMFVSAMAHGQTTTILSSPSSQTQLAPGTTAVTQTTGDNTTKVATDAFVLANAGSSASGSTQTAGTGGVTANTFLQVDGSSPAKYITSPLQSSGGDCQGTSTTSATAGSTFTLLDPTQTWQILSEGAITADHYVSISNATAGYASDTGYPATGNTSGIPQAFILCGISLTSTTGAGQLVTLKPLPVAERGGNINVINYVSLTGLGSGQAYLTGGQFSVPGTPQVIASATTIAPANPLAQVVFTGTTSIGTVTLPSNFTAGCFDNYNTSALATTTAGNIAAVYSLTAATQYRWCYWPSLSKWVVK
jgi:hypothetical protein